MNRFQKIFRNKKCNIIGMIHVDSLPGTPLYKGNWQEVIDKAKHEANIYRKHKLDSILIENMHDIPYVKQKDQGPEVTACMSRLATEIRRIMPHTTPVGLQILAGANKMALAVAKACDLQYIRAESFVFGHIADEGYMDACAGQLLRYRKQINAENILVFTDLKKKHSSHAITQDVDLLETAKAAELFLTDGIIITGASTGIATKPNDLIKVAGHIKMPILIGSGVTLANIINYATQAHAVIIGSFFKKHGYWKNDLCEATIEEFMCKIFESRIESTKSELKHIEYK